jgi:hypothetical protein
MFAGLWRWYWFGHGATITFPRVSGTIDVDTVAAATVDVSTSVTGTIDVDTIASGDVEVP